ncbi:MAG: membrane protein insertion efficiency factor YidD [Pseudomonadota bacterium]
MQNSLIGVLKLYRFLISPFFGQRCRFYPSCSHYAEDALRMHGIFRGCLLAVWRLLRCHPLSAGGFDPVPEGKRVT